MSIWRAVECEVLWRCLFCGFCKSAGPSWQPFVHSLTFLSIGVSLGLVLIFLFSAVFSPLVISHTDPAFQVLTPSAEAPSSALFSFLNLLFLYSQVNTSLAVTLFSCINKSRIKFFFFTNSFLFLVLFYISDLNILILFVYLKGRLSRCL